MNQTNDPGITPAERLAALRTVAAGETFPQWVVESNNHIHTPSAPTPRPGLRWAPGARGCG